MVNLEKILNLSYRLLALISISLGTIVLVGAGDIGVSNTIIKAHYLIFSFVVCLLFNSIKRTGLVNSEKKELVVLIASILGGCDIHTIIFVVGFTHFFLYEERKIEIDEAFSSL